MDPIRLGIVGPGLIWENAHRPVLDAMVDRIVPVAFSATRDASRQKVARDYPHARYYSDYRELVAQPDLDAVLVMTPIALNYPVGMAALEAGKHVYLEKPMARKVEEAEALVRTARERGRQLFVLEQVAYNPGLASIREALRSGALGRIVMYDSTLHDIYDWGEHSFHGYGTTSWRIQPDFPLGTLYDGGHHTIAQLSRLFGQPCAVTASGESLRPEYGEYDHVLMLFEYADGMHGVLSHSDYLGGGRNYFYIRGTEGVLSLGRDGGAITDREGRETRKLAFTRPHGHASMWHEAIACLEQGREPCYPPEDALSDIITLHAIARSAAQRARVEIR